MQTVKHRCCAYGNALGEPMPPGHELLRTCKFVRRIRYSRAQGAMRAAPIVMSNPLLQDQPKVPLRYRNYPVKAFAPNCPDHSFADRVCPRRTRWGFQHRQAQCPDRIIHRPREDAVPVVNQVTVRVVEPYHFAQLDQGPLRTRVRCDGDTREPAAAVLNSHENIEQSESRCDRHEEIARHYGFSVSLQKRCPSLVASRLAIRALRHVLADRPRRHSDAQFHQQFAGDSLLTPERIVARHDADQPPKLDGNSRAPGSTLPSPEQAPPGALPANQCLRLDYKQCIPPIEQPR